jgi:dolichyl-phosphate-mannose-protein mannosyltransferase
VLGDGPSPTSSVPIAQSSEAMPAEAVTPKQGEPNVVSREETVEYRDQDGNLLDEAAVQALLAEGKAKFETKYETRTRVVDEAGNEVPPVAPDHPDVQGQNPDTKGVPEQKGKSMPANAQAEAESVERERLNKAQPASDANEATK